jgi:hypothetical protein
MGQSTTTVVAPATSDEGMTLEQNRAIDPKTASINTGSDLDPHLASL